MSPEPSIIEVRNPYDQAYIDSVALVDWREIDSHIERAHELSRDRSQWLPKYERISILKKTAQFMQDQYEVLAFQIANEGGKPLVDARVEVARAIDGVELCVKELDHLRGEEIPMDLTPAGSGHMAFTTREPIGPVVAISAFNHPLNLIVHQVAPAIAVGCPVLVKPAENTPLSCRSFVSMLHQAGLPEDWCRFVPCKVEDASKMVTDPRIAFFSFIGSAKVGWHLRSQLAPGTRCALEHGGVAPVIIDQYSHEPHLINSLVKGGFYHSGQVCVSVQRVYVRADEARTLAEKMAQKAATLKVGNATDPETDCGPLIRPEEVDRVAEWVDEAVREGAQLITGGKKLSPSTYAPTILLDPPEHVTISQREVFGPVICIYSYQSLDEAFKRANSLPYAFQASIYSDDLNVAMQGIQQLDATAVMVNDHTAFRTDWMPFAGRRHSGYNTGGIGYTMHDMTQDKMAVIYQQQ